MNDLIREELRVKIMRYYWIWMEKMHPEDIPTDESLVEAWENGLYYDEFLQHLKDEGVY